MKKVVSLLLCLLIISTTSSMAFAADKNGPIGSKAQELNLAEINAYKTTLNINGKVVTAIHKDAPGTVAPADVQPPWTLSYHSVTSTHFQQLVAASIAALLAAKFGGKYSDYLALATAITGGGIAEFTGDVYEDVYYHWQPSGNPQLPYYIKQFIVYYDDSSLTHYKGSTTRYYYSNLPY